MSQGRPPLNQTEIGALPPDADFIAAKTRGMEEEPFFEGIPREHIEDLSHQAESWKAISKQEQDFLYASLLLRGRYLNERTLRRELKNWTPFGDVRLRDLIAARQLVDDEALARLDRLAEESIRDLQRRSPWQDAVTVAQRTSNLLENIDASGCIAKIFGLSLVPKGVVGLETRAFRARYRLIRKLGQGGLGIVWLAIDESLNRYVAVKEISGAAEQHPVAIARFKREAEITGRLDHPSIVPIHLLAENEADGRVFYVMRFLGNQTLDDAIREYHERLHLGQNNPMVFHRLLTAFVSVCQAIAYAHSHRVIHRDLKPQNIALDSFGQVIVLDWGLAKILGMEDPDCVLNRADDCRQLDQLDVTLAGQVIGTPMYMAPEQAAGRIDEIDEQTDIYGLGAILFAILTGYAPHERSHESLMAGTSVASLLDLIVELPTASPINLNPTVPPALDAICMKAMAKHRYLRYASAADLSDDLQRWLADEPISARQDNLIKRIQRWIKKNSRLSKAIFLTAAAITVFCAFRTFEAYRAAMLDNQRRIQTVTDETRRIRGRVAHEVEALWKTAKYLTALPLIPQSNPEEESTNAGSPLNRKAQTEKFYQGLLQVNPHYVAVTQWSDHPERGTEHLRVERFNVTSRTGGRDWKHFFQKEFSKGDLNSNEQIVLGISRQRLDGEITEAPTTGILSKVSDPHGQVFALAVAARNSPEEPAGGTLLECDLEPVLDVVTANVGLHGLQLDIADTNGRCFLNYCRERGLTSVDYPISEVSNDADLAQYFKTGRLSEIYVQSPKLCAGKIPFDDVDQTKFLGIIVRFE